MEISFPDQEDVMKELVEMLTKETGLSKDKAEKAVTIVADFIKKDLPLSARTAIDLALEDVSRKDLNEDKQPFTIP